MFWGQTLGESGLCWSEPHRRDLHWDRTVMPHADLPLLNCPTVGCPGFFDTQGLLEACR